MMTPTDTTLVILAGGRGSRMGVRKDHVAIQGVMLLQLMLERIAWKGPTLLVGPADRVDLEGQERVDRVVYDDVEGEGPLRGIHVALRAVRTSTLVVIPIDMPGLAASHLAWLTERAAECIDASGVLLRRTETESGRLEPFPLWCRACCRPHVSRMLAQGERSVRALAGMPGMHIVAAPQTWDEKTWWNLNHPEDVARFEATLTKLDHDAGSRATTVEKTASSGRVA